jgi:hypothetical protein
MICDTNEVSFDLGDVCTMIGGMVCKFPSMCIDGKESIGDLCLMGNGNYMYNPTKVSAYLRYVAGWCSASEIVPGEKYRLSSKSNSILMLRKKGSMDEYMLLENRQKRGRDKRIHTNGVLIWHIYEDNESDQEFISKYNNTRCTLVKAGGDKETPSQEDAFVGRIFSAKTHSGAKWQDNTPLDVELDVSENGAIMTVECRQMQ